MAFISNLKKHFAYYIFGILAISLLLILFFTIGSKDVPVIDFTDVVDINDSQNSDVESSLPPLRIAVSPMLSPEYTKKYYGDLLKIIGSKMGMRMVLIQKRTYSEANSMLESKNIDIVFVCSGAYVNGHEKFGMEILAIPVSNGKKVYHSYIIVHWDSPFRSFDDLKGKRFAFTDPVSNTGFLVPNYMLRKSGKKSRTYFSETLFTYSHNNSIKAVAVKLVDAAAVDSLVWEFMNAQKNKYSLQTRVIIKSPPYGIPPIVVHPDMEKEVKNRLKNILLNLHNDKDAIKYLDILQIDRFAEGNDQMYENIRRLIKEN